MGYIKGLLFDCSQASAQGLFATLTVQFWALSLKIFDVYMLFVKNSRYWFSYNDPQINETQSKFSSQGYFYLKRYNLSQYMKVDATALKALGVLEVYPPISGRPYNPIV